MSRVQPPSPTPLFAFVHKVFIESIDFVGLGRPSLLSVREQFDAWGSEPNPSALPLQINKGRRGHLP
jgi:hypothetical protein